VFVIDKRQNAISSLFFWDAQDLKQDNRVPVFLSHTPASQKYPFGFESSVFSELLTDLVLSF